MGLVSGGRGIGRNVWSAGLLALAASCAGPVPGRAAEPEEDRPSPSRLLFGSLDAGPAKLLVSQGGKLVLGAGSLSTSGFRILVATAQSTERPRLAPAGNQLQKLETQLLIGFEWRLRGGSFAIYAGPELQAERWTRETLPRHRIGQRLHLDLWHGLGRGWTLQAGAYAAALDRRLWLRLAPGWALPWQGRFGRPMLGPELELYRQERYDKLRLGLHLGGLRLFKLNWRVSAGWERASRERSHLYATLGVHAPR